MRTSLKRPTIGILLLFGFSTLAVLFQNCSDPRISKLDAPSTAAAQLMRLNIHYTDLNGVRQIMYIDDANPHEIQFQFRDADGRFGNHSETRWYSFKPDGYTVAQLEHGPNCPVIENPNWVVLNVDYSSEITKCNKIELRYEDPALANPIVHPLNCNPASVSAVLSKKPITLNTDEFTAAMTLVQIPAPPGIDDASQPTYGYVGSSCDPVTVQSPGQLGYIDPGDPDYLKNAYNLRTGAKRSYYLDFEVGGVRFIRQFTLFKRAAATP